MWKSVNLPCAVNSTVYYINWQERRVVAAKVVDYQYQYYLVMNAKEAGGKKNHFVVESQWGTEVFSSQIEAENALRTA